MYIFFILADVVTARYLSSRLSRMRSSCGVKRGVTEQAIIKLGKIWKSPTPVFRASVLKIFDTFGEFGDMKGLLGERIVGGEKCRMGSAYFGSAPVKMAVYYCGWFKYSRRLQKLGFHML